jgi:hypothetical protein
MARLPYIVSVAGLRHTRKSSLCHEIKIISLSPKEIEYLKTAIFSVQFYKYQYDSVARHKN